MPVPVLTHDQRVAASAKAVEIRTKRAGIKQQLKTSQVSLRELIEAAHHDDVVAGMKVLSVLEALPGIGHVKATALMSTCGVAPSRRLRGLGPHQAAALCRVLDGRSR
jgi:hypothetical protein